MRTRRSDPGGPGYRRRRRGRGFSYADADGNPLSDGEVDRIAALAIPPAWRAVWICPDPHGHIQAVGTDAAGRRQYRYHDAWRARRDREKFDHVLDVARRLPRLRRTVAGHLTGRGLGRARVLAAAVRLLDLGAFRVGGEEYANGDAAGCEASAKDFRTWHATVLAAAALASEPPPRSARAGARVINRVCREVADHLGNTPAVVRKSYVDPRVFDLYLDGVTIAAPPRMTSARALRRVELAVLRLLAG